MEAHLEQTAPKEADWKKSASIVDESLLLGTSLSAALKKISAVVSEVYKFAEEISAATKEQFSRFVADHKATPRLTEIRQEIDSSVGEQASGAQAIVKTMEKMRELVQQSSSSSVDLAASAEQMSGMAQDMMTAVGRFKLEAAHEVPN